jgi:hypothetical protein
VVRCRATQVVMDEDRMNLLTPERRDDRMVPTTPIISHQHGTPFLAPLAILLIRAVLGWCLTATNGVCVDAEALQCIRDSGG